MSKFCTIMIQYHWLPYLSLSVQLYITEIAFQIHLQWHELSTNKIILLWHFNLPSYQLTCDTESVIQVSIYCIRGLFGGDLYLTVWQIWAGMHAKLKTPFLIVIVYLIIFTQHVAWHCSIFQMAGKPSEGINFNHLCHQIKITPTPLIFLNKSSKYLTCQ